MSTPNLLSPLKLGDQMPPTPDSVERLRFAAPHNILDQATFYGVDTEIISNVNNCSAL